MLVPSARRAVAHAHAGAPSPRSGNTALKEGRTEGALCSYEEGIALLDDLSGLDGAEEQECVANSHTDLQGKKVRAYCATRRTEWRRGVASHARGVACCS